MNLRYIKNRKTSSVWLLLAFFLIILSQCPESTKTLIRIGKTRYYIIQNITQRGDFVTIEQAREDCSKHGLKLATVKNLLSLAVVGRPLERMAFKEKMKDTWYWLDAKYDMKSEKYHWGNDANDELRYSIILYRTPRPIGVSSHITYNNIYKKDQDKPQCLTLALPWLGSADHHINTTIFFGHQTSFDERDCNSKKKRHAMCEASKKNCPSTESKPYVLDEEKLDYFEGGNWIFGNRKYIVNWKQKTFNESERYCKSLGLQLMNAGNLEKFLIPHIKMWSREITVSQFWTGMSYHDETKQYMDSSGNAITDANTEHNFTESDFGRRSSKNSPIFCVALSLAYEFQSQMPCSNNASSGCQWSFIRYAPANCNNYHGSICQHLDYEEREIKWYPNFKTNLDEVLEKTALTTGFGYKGNEFVLRSKYKQTFGLCYCPKGFRMIRSNNKTNLGWSVKPSSTIGKEIYEYDYTESYWLVDNDSFNKDKNSKCLLSYTDKEDRKFKEIKCMEWFFYLCERLGKRPTEPSLITVNKSPPMIWKEGPQPRVYPLVSITSVYDTLCPCKLEKPNMEWNAVTNECVKRWKECPSNMFDNDHCQRAGYHVFYSIGGVICNSRKQNDRCTFEKILYTYLGNFSLRNQDEKGIIYEPDLQLHRRWNLAVEHWSTQEINYYSKWISARDRDLYKIWHGGISGNLPSVNKTEKDLCATLLFDIAGDGRYEISIKLADFIYNEYSIGPKYKRAFNILLNDMYIAREFNPNEYREIRHGLELNANFRVYENGKMLELQGHSTKNIDAKKLKLEMCYSFCARIGYNADPNWMMSSISIVKFSNKPDDPCECKFGNADKEYHAVTRQCVDRFDTPPPTLGGCHHLDYVYNDNFCTRGAEHIFHTFYGTVCNHKRTWGNNCGINMTIYAVNFNGTRHKDDRGITYDKLNKRDWLIDPDAWFEGPSPLKVQNVPTKDIEIYKTLASSSFFLPSKSLNKSHPRAFKCAAMLFQTYGDGYYEIAMKTAEFFHKENKYRSFSVILNDMYIVEEFMVERYKKSPSGVELVANFKIYENNLVLQGHPEKKIERNDKKLQLEICHSNCGNYVLGLEVEQRWILCGLSIVKFNTSFRLKSLPIMTE